MLLTVRAVADETASLDNSQAITESPQSKPPGFHVNPPVHADKWRSAQDEPNSSLKAKEPLETKQGRECLAGCYHFVWNIKKPSLPVNDYRV